MKPLTMKPRSKRDWLNATVAQRRAWKQEIFIGHPRVSRAISIIAQRVERCQRSEKGDGVFISGPSGSGKSRLVSYLKQIYQLKEGEELPDISLKPIIEVKIPDVCTRKRVLLEVLKGLGSPDDSGTFHECMARAKVQMRACQVKVVTIDNLQDVPARRTMRGVQDVALCIRDLIDETSAVFVLLGTKEAKVVVDGDAQLRRRVPCRHHLQYFDLLGIPTTRLRTLIRAGVFPRGGEARSPVSGRWRYRFDPNDVAELAHVWARTCTFQEASRTFGVPTASLHALTDARVLSLVRWRGGEGYARLDVAELGSFARKLTLTQSYCNARHGPVIEFSAVVRRLHERGSALLVFVLRAVVDGRLPRLGIPIALSACLPMWSRFFGCAGASRFSTVAKCTK